MATATYDVAVVGGGIIGCSAAALLAERGTRVVLVEATSIGAGASGRNLGVLQYPFDPVLTGLYADSMARYRALAAEDDAFDVPDRAAGILLLNHDPAAAREQAARLALVAPGLSPTYLDPATVAELEPSLAPGPAACRLDTGHPIPPASATEAWARAAQRRGVSLRIGQAAEVWRDAAGVRGVRLADGSRIPAGRVLVAAGPWTPPVVDPAGDWAPIVRTWGVTVQLRMGRHAPRHVVEEDHVDAVNRPVAAAAEAAAIGPDADPPSIFTLAAAGEIAILGSTFLPEAPDADRVARLLLERGIRHWPAIADAEVVGVRSCARPQSVDGRPFIGPIGDVDGLFVCAGNGPWGMSTGPASAALAVSALLDGGEVPRQLASSRAV